jgi:hypothetical protein
MSKALDKRCLEDSVDFIHDVTGLPRTIISLVIRAYFTFVMLQLSRGSQHGLFLVGILTPEEGTKSNTVSFKPSQRLKKILYTHKEVDFAEVLNQYRDFIDRKKKKIYQAELERFGRYTYRNAGAKLRSPNYVRRQMHIDAVRSDLLAYLQNELPYDLDWVHPTSEKVYSATHIANKVKMYRHIDPQGYDCLFAVWLSVKDRNMKLVREKLSLQEFEKRLGIVLDCLIILIVYDDLESEAAREYYQLGILNINVK